LVEVAVEEELEEGLRPRVLLLLVLALVEAEAEGEDVEYLTQVEVHQQPRKEILT
jgi:hypothetical protein